MARSRWNVVPSARRLVLTARDIALFQCLHRHGQVRSTMLARLFGASILDRLKDLTHEAPHYLKRVGEKCHIGQNGAMVYRLSPAGLEVLWQEGYFARDDSEWTTHSRVGEQRQFLHAQLISDIGCLIEIGLKDHPHIRYIPIKEILDRAPCRGLERPLAVPVTLARDGEKVETAVVPDNLFGLEYRLERSYYRFFAVEANRATEVWRPNLRQASHAKKFLGYKALVEAGLHKSHFGLSTLSVLMVQADENVTRRSMKLLAEMGGSPRFLFKTMGGQGYNRYPPPTPAFLEEPWPRVGHPPLDLTQVTPAR